MTKKKIVLLGGGPANLIAAYFLSDKHEVVLYEKGKTVGRKFLVAGNGGFNLTNKASGQDLRNAYSKHAQLNNALLQFDSVACVKWLEEIGVETFVGSSGRVFPIEGIKPILVLKKLIVALEKKNVKIITGHEFVGFNVAKNPIIRNKDGESAVTADHYFFGLGGGSWNVTGTNHKWLSQFEKLGVLVHPFQASNCGLNINWPTDFVDKFAGFPVKNVAVKANDYNIKGELLITKYGLEGNAIYPLSSVVRRLLEGNEKVEIRIDFKPNNTESQLIKKAKNIKPKNYAYTFNLDKVSFHLLKNSLSKADYLDATIFAKQLKNKPLEVISLRSVEEAISTVGGIDLQEVTTDFSLIKVPKVSIVGEMLDWDAPTGGFLLQGCFAIGYTAAQNLLKD